jgi:galactan 5-O-arabinofuranosyltransferase
VSARTEAEAGDLDLTAAAPAPDLPGRPVRLAAGAGEVVAAVGAALLALQLSGSVDVDPLDRVGQVSGLAALDLQFVLLGLAVLVACIAAARFPRVFAVVGRVACAAVAGLATALVAGGVVLALHGTTWGLFANWGDSGQLIRWADDIVAGRPVPPDYPPAVLHLIARWAELTGDSTAGALRTSQVLGTALFGPLAYLSWRLVLTPVWALAVTLVAAMPLLEPYKPYTTVVLVALVPLLIAFVQLLHRAAGQSWTRLAIAGAVAGVLLGVLFNVYSGWFLWSAPGALVAVLVRFPWRAPLRGLTLLATALAGLVAIAWPHLFGLIAAAGTVQDRYFYFDTAVEPAYIAMWRNDLPGDVGPWPPPGELGGVGVFTVLLVVGLGVAVAVGARRTAVITAGALLAGAWVLRLAIASQMYDTQTVQLYPRTTAEILFCLLVLAVLAARYGGRRLQDAWRARTVTGNGRVPRNAAPLIGALSAALLLALSMGSATADRYLPRNDKSVGLLAFVAQNVREPDGTCPEFSGPSGCAPDPGALLRGDWRPDGDPISR